MWSKFKLGNVLEAITTILKNTPKEKYIFQSTLDVYKMFANLLRSR